MGSSPQRSSCTRAFKYSNTSDLCWCSGWLDKMIPIYSGCSQNRFFCLFFWGLGRETKGVKKGNFMICRNDEARFFARNSKMGLNKKWHFAWQEKRTSFLVTLQRIAFKYVLATPFMVEQSKKCINEKIIFFYDCFKFVILLKSTHPHTKWKVLMNSRKCYLLSDFCLRSWAENFQPISGCRPVRDPLELGGPGHHAEVLHVGIGHVPETRPGSAFNYQRLDLQYSISLLTCKSIATFLGMNASRVSTLV